MLVPLPQLDDIRWAGLVEEGRSLIPVHAPEWTDHNASDPGITLVELLAWIAEMQVFELDRVPARNRLRFLGLVGVRPEPPRPARTVLRFGIPPGSGARTVPEGTVCAAAGEGGSTLFRTLRELTVVAAGVVTLTSDSGDQSTDLTARWRRGEPFAPFGDDPAPGAALTIAVDAPLAEGTTLALAITCAGDTGGARERARLDAAATRHHDASTVWELRVGPARWRTLEVDDETRALTLDGHVDLRMPADAYVAAGRSALRCRFAAGAYDAAPLLSDLSLNGVAAEQSVREAKAAADLSAPGRTVGRGTGGPGQSVTVAPAPVDARTARVWTVETSGRRDWTLEPDLEASGPADAHAVLDATSGAIRFGDGERGLAPPAGAVILASHRSTRAERGNLPAGAVDRLAGEPYNAGLDATGLTVRSTIPATGGAPAETLEHAEGRAVELAVAVTRAVTLDDLRRVALDTPGTRVARAEARANLHPAMPCIVAAGVLSLVVLPHLPRHAPSPSRGLLRAVRAQLEPRRLIGSRIEVAGPEYTAVSVRAQVRARRLAEPSLVRSRVVEALDRFLHPLDGGPDGNGWPLGRDVVSAEVLRVIDDVSGVDHVLRLELIGPDGASCGNLCIGPLGLPEARAHAIEVLAA